MDKWISLSRQLGDVLPPALSLDRGGGIMVTYSFLIQFVIMLCAVITLVLYAIKK